MIVVAPLADVDVMALLDRGSNLWGPLAPRIRARLFVVIDNPTQETWDDAYTIIIIDRERWLTLWQALLWFTDYDVRSRPSDWPWPSVPTSQQITAALTAALGEG